MDKIDKVFYINLKHRADRRFEIEDELKNKFLFDKAERYEAVLHKHPILGCTMSHISIWRNMIENNWKTVMILEDDAMLQTTRENIDKHINRFLEDSSADLLSISNSCGEHVHYNELFERAFNSQTSSCYVVKLESVKELIKYYFKNPDDIYTLKEDDPNLHEKIHWIDVAWLEYQKVHNFLIPKEQKIVIQRRSYSDIQRKITFYNL
jgi:GR25 family glycosyltransferase involved in LPS biosynthesis